MRILLLSAVIGIALLPPPPPAQIITDVGGDVDRAALDVARKVLAERRTKNFLVLRHGRIVYEWYAPDSGPRIRHYTASLAKAIVGGLSLLVALQDGRLAADDRASRYIPAWRTDPRKSHITIRHLATHSSGVEDAEQDQIAHDKLPGWKGAFWKRQPDPFTIALREAPVIFDPGTRYAYSNPGMAALAYAVTASLRDAPQRDIRSVLETRILDPIGVADDEWSIGYGQAYEVDGLNLYANWGGGAFTARAVARIGQLMLQRGRWEDRQLLDAGRVAEVTAYAGTPRPARAVDDPAPGSGLAWWTNDDGVWASVPRDAFAGAGAGHQVLLVVPSLDLVVVRNGGLLREPGEPAYFWWAIQTFLFDPVVRAVSRNGGAADAAPYPPSQVISGITWAPAAHIVRRAAGSDNWPTTWAQDDNLYTAYGDGWGFEPKTEKKLSLGFARVAGGPDDPIGTNIRSPTGERLGDGRAGEKASGMLSVGGTLYMLVRNAGNARLAWSTDRATTWTWSDWTFATSFGHPAFLNFGKEYSGARDRYAYIYSPDRDSAYEPADRLVLARVPIDRIRDREAYEFFQATDAQGRPRWTRDIAQRGAVFSHRQQCYRSQVTYHPGLKRYLLCQVLPRGDARFEGGFGIYDAPEPWGPWTTVAFTRQWDVGPGESCSFPAKWIEAAGGYLVSSGDDSFSVRRATFHARRR